MLFLVGQEYPVIGAENKTITVLKRTGKTVLVMFSGEKKPKRYKIRREGNQEYIKIKKEEEK